MVAWPTGGGGGGLGTGCGPGPTWVGVRGGQEGEDGAGTGLGEGGLRGFLNTVQNKRFRILSVLGKEG